MKIKVLLGLLLAVMLGSNVQAGFVLRAAGPTGGFSNSITANLGESVNLYLVEDTNLSFTSDAGSFNLNTAANFVTPVASGVASGWQIREVVAPFRFNNGAPFGAASSTSLFGVQAVQVGSLTMSNFGTASFSFADIDAGNQVRVNNGQVIDGTVFQASPSFNITAVPEPSSMALLGIVGAGLAAVRRFRRKTMA